MAEKFILIRTMEFEFLEKLKEYGEILFKPTKFFRELEKNDPRKDPNDNKPKINVMVSEDAPLKIGEVTIFESKIQVGGLQNIYCFTGINEGNYRDFLLQADIEKFGEHAIIVHKPKKLIARIRKKKQKIESDFVKYVDQEIIDNQIAVDAFQKAKKFSGEYEYRLAYFEGSMENEFLTIGSIDDICEIVPITELFTKIKEYFE